LEPMERSVEDIKAIFAEIDRLGGNDFLPEGRPEQRPSRSRVVRRSAGPSTATSRRRGSLAPTVCSRRHQPS
jgi:hypothetical protein